MVKKIFTHTYFPLFLIILLGVFLRFYQLGYTPAGLINDEADTGYDAYSILLTGHDQWNAFMPLVSMRGFGDYRPALYTYLVAGSEKLFGLTPFAVRFPSALLGTISILLIYIIGKKIFSSSIGYIAALLLAISPWAIGMSRVGIESNVAITFTLFGLCAFLYAKNRLIFLLLGIIAFLLAFYTYAAYTLFIPLAGLAVWFFWKKNFSLSKKSIIISFVVIVFFCIPFILGKSTAHTRLSQVGFFNSLDTVGLTAGLNDRVGACIHTFPSLFCKGFLNKPLLFSSVYVKNYLSHFSPDFLYISGNSTQFAILPNRGLEYIIEAVFAISGLAYFIKTKKKEGIFILLLLLFAVVPDAITGEGHYSRATVMLPFLLLIEACGFFYLFSFFASDLQKKMFALVCSTILVMSVGGFWVTYNSYFREQYALYSQYGYQDLIQNINKEKSKYDNIYLSRHLNDTKQYIYYLFYNSYEPHLYQQKTHVAFTQGSDGWISIDRIGNINFVTNIFTKAEILTDKNHDLIISNPVDFPQGIQAVFTVQDLQNNVIFEAVDSSVLKNYFITHAETKNI